jgi:hypothetical protein
MIEMSHPLRHIIMKRSYFLRSTKARTLFCREQIAGKSWLEVSLAEKPNSKNDVLPWDQAHNLAEKFKAELKADVFVEPAREGGRHHKLAVATTASPFSSDEQPENGYKGIAATAFNHDHSAGFGGSIRVSGPGFGREFGMLGLGANSMLGASMPGSGISGSSGLGSTDFLPAHVKEALSLDEKPDEMVLHALRSLPAFIELPEATRNMYEVEAMQLLNGMLAQLGASEHDSSLVALLQLPYVSKHLRRFLAQALPVAA